MANILSQEEIDALLGAAERGELKDDGSIAGTEGPAITDYNFRRPNLITKDQLREFTNLHETFVREAQTSLSLLMRASTEFRMVSTEQQQYSEFIGSLPTISHLALYSAEPLPGSIAIEINLALVFGLVDLRLGGSGGIETSIRQPTELEVAIIEPIIRKISNHLQDSWKDFVEGLKFKLLRYESNPEYLQAAPADAPMVVLAFDAKVGAETNGIINICYPVPMILALLEKISSKGGQMDNYYGKAKDVNEIRKRLLSTLMNLPMGGKVVLGKSNLLGRELVELCPGDIIVLDKKVGSPLVFSILAEPLFKGYPGRRGDSLCFKINQYHGDEDGALG